MRRRSQRIPKTEIRSTQTWEAEVNILASEHPTEVEAILRAAYMCAVEVECLLNEAQRLFEGMEGGDAKGEAWELLQSVRREITRVKEGGVA